MELMYQPLSNKVTEEKMKAKKNSQQSQVTEQTKSRVQRSQGA